MGFKIWGDKSFWPEYLRMLTCVIRLRVCFVLMTLIIGKLDFESGVCKHQLKIQLLI